MLPSALKYCSSLSLKLKNALFIVYSSIITMKSVIEHLRSSMVRVLLSKPTTLGSSDKKKLHTLRLGEITSPRWSMAFSFGSSWSHKFTRPPTWVIDELKWSLMDEISNIGQDVLERSFWSFRDWLQNGLSNGQTLGGHILSHKTGSIIFLD